MVQQDILSPVVPLCFLRGWESSPFSAEGGQPSCTRCTHTLRLYGARERCLPAWRRGAFCARARTVAHGHTHTHTSRDADPPPDVTATPKPHWLPTWSCSVQLKSCESHVAWLHPHRQSKCIACWQIGRGRARRRRRRREYSYCMCRVTNVFPPQMSFKGKRGGSLFHNSTRHSVARW